MSKANIDKNNVTTKNTTISTKLHKGNFVPTNIALIDSLSLKIPLKDCQVLDPRLTSQTCIYYESLDAVDDELLPARPLVFQKDGITVRIRSCEIPIYKADTEEFIATKFIDLTVSAKLLKKKYFEGINKTTAKDLYKTFLEFGVFTCSYEVFLSGMVNDIDICVNRYTSSPAVFQSLLVYIIEKTGTKEKYLKSFLESGNLGLNFNKRETAKPSLPFIKFYHKEMELRSKSKQFLETFLIEYEEMINGLTRVEATIKNYKHKKRLDKYGIVPMFKTFGDLLEVDQQDLMHFMTFSLESYITEEIRLKAPNLAPSDHLIFELMQSLVLKGLDLETLLCHADTFQGSKQSSEEVAKTRLRKKIVTLYSMLDCKESKIAEVIKKNEEVSEYLNFLKIPLFEPNKAVKE